MHQKITTFSNETIWLYCVWYEDLLYKVMGTVFVCIVVDNLRLLRHYFFYCGLHVAL